MEKSVLRHTGLFVFIVTGLLLLMNGLPGLTWRGRVLRRVDILGDVRPPVEALHDADSLLPPPPEVKPAFVDTRSEERRVGKECRL